MQRTIAAMIFAATTCPAWADNAALAAQIGKRYQDCAYTSVASQLKEQPAAELNMAAEVAFVACASEERVIRLFLATNNISARQVEAAVLKMKIDIKNTLQDMQKNPSKYM